MARRTRKNDTPNTDTPTPVEATPEAPAETPESATNDGGEVNVNFVQMSDEELNAALEKAKRERSARRRAERSQAVANQQQVHLEFLQRIASEAKSAGVPYRAIKQYFTELSRPADKYRDENGNRWAGRGRTPLWIIEYENNGGSREDFLVTD